ncbi:nicotinate-nucleotide--dimethylbenzimidazole phosphoribosyltransferase [Colwelliaceae bacterium MEBiC 14330]
MISVPPLSTKLCETIQAKIDNKTKPIGSLGVLETLALQLALITAQRNSDNDKTPTSVIGEISLAKPAMLVFAADHGINEEKLSIAPSAVTKQMVLNFLHGGAAINCFCQSNNIALTVIDCGILSPVEKDELPNSAENNSAKALASPVFKEQRLGAGTHNFVVADAMSIEQVKQGYMLANELVQAQIAQGVELILVGEMGIANTSSAAALMAVFTQYDVQQCVGRGTGITDEQLARKITLIEKAIQQFTFSRDHMAALSQDEVIAILAKIGGFEIVQMVFTILAAAAASIPVVIDGFIVSVAALVAIHLEKNVANYLVFSHISQEKAHQVLVEELMSAQTFTTKANQALLDLGLRLGEGTGAALALPLLSAAANFYNNMASFDSAGVTV